MLISVSDLLKREDSEKKISVEVDLSDVSFSPFVVRFIEPVRVNGRLKNAGGVILLEAVADGAYLTICDRCGAEIKKSIQFEIRENYVRTPLDMQEDDEAIILSGDQQIDLLKTVSSFAFSAIPTKHLCKTDCKGLCPKCGKDLNVETCSCKEEEWDPRFEALKGLFD